VPLARLHVGLIDARRAGLLFAAFGVTVSIGLWLSLKAQYYGLPLPLTWLAVALPAWLALTRRTGLALAAVLLYMGLLDGLIRLKTGGQAATLGRDVLLYAVAAGMALRAPRPFRAPPLSRWVVAWIVVIGVQVANPGDLSVAHAVASLRQHLEFVPLFFIGYVALRSHASLRVFFALLLAVATLNGAVAAYQSSLSVDQLSSWGPGYAHLLSGDGARVYWTSAYGGKPRVRPPALGGDEGFGGEVGAAALPGGIILLMTARRRWWWRVLILCGIVGAVISIVTSEQRTDIIMASVSLLALLGLVTVGGQGRRALLALSLGAVIGGGVILAVVSYDSAALARYSSIAPGHAGSTIYNSRAGTWSLLPRYMAKIPLGVGLGTVGPAAAKIGGKETNWNAESQFNFLVVEAGIPALVVFIAFQCVLCATIVRGLYREQDPQAALLMAALAAPLFGVAASWFVGVYTTVPPTAPYLWLAAGAISWWLVTRQRQIEAGESMPEEQATRVQQASIPGGRLYYEVAP